MSLKGMAAVKKLKKEMDANREAFSAGFTPNFSLADGETALVRFNGSAVDEPYIVSEHSVMLNKQFRTEVCAKDLARKKKHVGCVPCYLRKHGDRRVGNASSKACYNLVDSRWIHKVVDTERSTGDRERYKYFPCADTNGRPCPHCKKKVARERVGQEKWTMSLTWAQAISAVDDKLKKRCIAPMKSGRPCGGKTKIVGFVDTTTGEMHDSVVEDREEDFEASYECEKCGDLCQPRTIFDVWLEVTRSGKQKNTSYQFSIPQESEIEDLEELQKLLAECKPVDLESANRPRTAEKQAERLGVDNPFDEDGGGSSGRRGGNETTSYEEEEEAEGSELF